MNGYLLDTHVVLWWLDDASVLKEQAREIISTPTNPVFVSAAAVWEMAIKKALGRLDMPSNLLEVLAHEKMEVLAIDAQHALAVADLPMIHPDPFDRMQIAQAKLEGLTLITRDGRIGQYGIACVEA